MKNRILIADDDLNFTTALAARLEASHYDVLTANDGFEAMKLALKEDPDLIILDMWMPIGIGLSVAERINEYQLRAPLIFLTGCRDQAVRQAAKEVGAAAFIEKPYEPEALLETIERVLEQNSPVTTG